MGRGGACLAGSVTCDRRPSTRGSRGALLARWSESVAASTPAKSTSDFGNKTYMVPIRVVHYAVLSTAAESTTQRNASFNMGNCREWHDDAH